MRKPGKRACASVEPAKRVKITVSLDGETAAKLRALAGYTGRDVSAVVAEGLAPLLSRFVVYGLSRAAVGGPEGPQDGPEGPKVYRAG